MKKFLALMLMIVCVIAAIAADQKAEPVSLRAMTATAVPAPKARKAGARAPVEQWITNVTTNDDMTITKTQTKGTTVVTSIWHNSPVPMKYRAKFHLMTEEDKANAIGAIQKPYLTETAPKEGQAPKIDDRAGDKNITEEIYLIYSR